LWFSDDESFVPVPSPPIERGEGTVGQTDGRCVGNDPAAASNLPAVREGARFVPAVCAGAKRAPRGGRSQVRCRMRAGGCVGEGRCRATREAREVSMRGYR
jgi:hypothetical protein